MWGSVAVLLWSIRILSFFIARSGPIVYIYTSNIEGQSYAYNTLSPFRLLYAFFLFLCSNNRMSIRPGLIRLCCGHDYRATEKTYPSKRGRFEWFSFLGREGGDSCQPTSLYF
jgi:hypothetical protein